MDSLVGARTSNVAQPLPERQASQDTAPAVVVTGASSGLGLELARAASRDYANVVLVARSRERLDRSALELPHNRTVVVDVDLTSECALQRIETALAENNLHCEVLINAAGASLWGPAVELGREEQLAVLDLNVRALTSLCLTYLPGMVARRRGGIINVASIAAYTVGPFKTVYHASKGYVRLFSLGLSSEVAELGVTVTCVSPGPVAVPRQQRRPDSPLMRSLCVAPGPIAAAAWQGFRQGRAEVVPGMRHWLLRWLTASTPTPIQAAILHRVMQR